MHWFICLDILNLDYNSPIADLCSPLNFNIYLKDERDNVNIITKKCAKILSVWLPRIHYFQLNNYIWVKKTTLRRSSMDHMGKRREHMHGKKVNKTYQSLRSWICEGSMWRTMMSLIWLEKQLSFKHRHQITN